MREREAGREKRRGEVRRGREEVAGRGEEGRREERSAPRPRGRGFSISKAQRQAEDSCFLSSLPQF